MYEMEEVSVSRGITMEHIMRMREGSYNFCRLVDESQREKEKERFSAAQQAVEIELTALIEQFNGENKEGQAEVLAAHKELVSARSFGDSVLTLIHKNHASAEAAVEDTVNEIISMLILLDNDYMWKRAVDIQGIGNRLLHTLQIISKLPGSI